MSTSPGLAPPTSLKTPMVGRLAERELLTQALQNTVQHGRPELVTIVGATGIGKSRLVTEFLSETAVRRPEVRAFRGTCWSERGREGALARILRQRLGLQDGTDQATWTAELTSRVAELFGERRIEEIVHFLGRFLGLQAAHDSPLGVALEEDPLAAQSAGKAVLRRFFEVDAQRSPIVLVFEELQHGNHEGVRFLREFIEGFGPVPVLFVVTARPELFAHEPQWPKALAARHVRIDLGPLSSLEATILARTLMASVEALPLSLVETTAELSGGNPMVAEQIVRVFWQQGLLELVEGRWLARPEKLPGLQLPMSVEEAVESRLAALTPAERELLEMAALMGPVFWQGGLVILARMDRSCPELWGGGEDMAPHHRDLLHGLEARDYVLQMPDSSLAEEEEWIFKHNLEREALERLASSEKAKRIHQVLAEWLEFKLVDRSEEALDLLAYHYERGLRPARAAHCLLEAANRARARYAHSKAAEQYARGIELLGELDVQTRVEAHHHLGDVLLMDGKPEKAKEQFRAMLELAFRMELRSKGGAAHNRLGRLYRDTGYLDVAMRHLGTALALFETAGDARGIASSYDDIGKVHWLRGDYDTALRFLQDALARREALGDPRSIALSLNNIGLVFQDSGQYRAAQESLQRALALRRQVEDLPGLVATLNNLGAIHQDRGEDEEALRLWNEGLEVSREIGDRRRQAVLMINIGESEYRLRRPARALEILMDVERVCQDLGDRLLLAECWRGIGKARLLGGELEVAKRDLERAVELFEQLRSKVHLAVAYRSLAEALATGGYGGADGDRAERLFRTALGSLEEVGHELEWARTAKLLSRYLEQCPPELAGALAHEVVALRQRADTLLQRVRRSSADVDTASGSVATRERLVTWEPISPPQIQQPAHPTDEHPAMGAESRADPTAEV